MSDEKAVLRPRRRRPASHARIGAGRVEIDRRAAAGLVRSRDIRQRFFMRAPAELSRLHPLGDEALDRPGVDEHAARFGGSGALGVALGDMDSLDAQLSRQRAPFGFCLGLGRDARVPREIDQRLLDEPGHHAGIGAAARHRRRAARILAPLGQNGLAQRVIGAGLVAELGVEIKAGPRLDDRIDIKNVQLARELDDVERANLDRKIDDKALALALGQQRRQNLAVIGLGQRGLKVVDPAHVEQMPMRVGGVDDGEAALVELEMPLEQRQYAPAD